MSVDDVWALYRRLEGRDGSLQATYSDIYTKLGLETGNPDYTYYKRVEQRDKLWWEKQGSDRDKTVNINFLHMMIEEQRTNLGLERSIRCPEPIDLMEDEAALAYANKLERGVLHLLREWRMGRQYSMLGFHQATLGNAIGLLWWSDSRGIPVFETRSPMGFFGVPSIDDKARLAQALFVQEVSGDSLAAQFPQARELAGTDKVLVADYLDARQRIRCAQDIPQPLEQAKNDLGRVLVYVFPGILMPGIYGASTMQLAMPIYQELQRLYSVDAEVLMDAIRAPTVINDPINVPEGWYWGEEATIEVGPQGKVGKAPFDVVDHAQLWKRIEDMKENLANVVDFAPIATGKPEGSIESGKGVTAYLTPREHRLQIRLQVINEVLEMVLEDALLLWNKKGKKGRVYGRESKSSFVSSFDPKADIKPEWCKVEVFIDSATYVDRQANEITKLQKVRGQPQLMSTHRYLELDPDCPDPDLEMKRMARERAETMAEMMQMQQASQPAQAPIKMAEVEASGAERGGEIPGAAPLPVASATAAGPGAQEGAPMPPEPTGEAAPLAGEPGGENEATLVALKEHFRSIKNIHGRIFLSGLAAKGDLSAGLTVYATDKTDNQTILNTFARDPELAQLHEDRAIHIVNEKPSGTLVEVTPGTEDGNDVIQGEEMEPEGITPEAMPELEGGGNALPI